MQVRDVDPSLVDSTQWTGPASSVRGSLSPPAGVASPAAPVIPAARRTVVEVTRQHLPELERRVLESAAGVGLLREMMTYQLASGGKRARAVLPVWVCENLGGSAEAALDLGAGLELLHNATLVHDDLQDGDTLRRGSLTVWKRFGAAQAINAGNALIFAAFARMLRAPAAPRLMDDIVEATMLLVEGQAMEFQLQAPPGTPGALPPTLPVWEAMARGKTGALFAACMRAGAAAAAAAPARIEEAACYGADIGLLFQVQDDYLDLVGDKGRERRGADMMEGKLSFPVIWAYENASRRDAAVIRAVIERRREERTWAMVDDALEALRACGALDATAAWLSTAQAAAEEHWMAEIVPGLAAQCLAPVASALGGARGTKSADDDLRDRRPRSSS